ncbi:MAG: ABC transporter substrate-binding protein [SAR86 cluster bacterium]|jgi:phospholipid transport system substrate-binding protein|nr:ABC transporter substrate-binding protein [SAR86 cluster bacterium]|tara:strand:+ start:19396 stop:19995 length:600 start_codon:yes stop_codon:yes gene_type:complete
MKAILTITFSFILIFSKVIYAGEAHDYVEKVHQEIIEIIKDQQGNYSNNPDIFIRSIEEALIPLVDFDRISRNVMGKKFYLGASTKQKDEFSKVFKISLLQTYAKTLAEFKDERIIILPKKEESKKPGRERVYLEIVTSSKNYQGMYSMYKDKQGMWKVINIIINGVNLGSIFKKQFKSLMNDKSNDYDQVILAWETSI